MVLTWTASLQCRHKFFKSLLHPKPCGSILVRQYSKKTVTFASTMTTQHEDKQKAPQQPPKERRAHWNPASSVYVDMGIDMKLYETAGGARFRQHVNPLKKELQVPADPLDWQNTYEDSSLPLILDVGCGYGRFLLGLAQAMPGYNHLGLEIRGPIVDRANRWADLLNLSTKVRFVLANATVSLENMLSSYPAQLSLVTIQFPDPHFKKRHRKRRTVQPQLVSAVKKLLPAGGRVFLQSDVLEVAEDMRDQFEREAGDVFEVSDEHASAEAVFFEKSEAPEAEAEEGASAEPEWESEWAKKGWLKDNPLPVPTERELHVTGQGLPVYRIMLEKKA